MAHTASLIVALSATAVLLLAGPAEQVEKRIDALLSRMTPDEKLGQMSQSTAMAHPITEEIKRQIRAGRWGSFLNAGDAADRAEAQRIALKESRLGIPLVFGRDVIHGYRTIFPIPLGQSASWDPELIAEAARQAALEATREGIHWTFAPMIDISRDPRWGRVAESLGEDPYLASVLGAAMIHGFQGVSIDRADSLAACAKHYAGYGAAEGGRDYNSAWIPEILLRDVYLRPFRAASEAGVATFMTGFNTLNGVPATANHFLLRDILRDEWKFDGVVVTDYEAVTNLIAHGYAVDARDAARRSLLAGADMEMVSTAYFDYLRSEVRANAAVSKRIDEAVRNILRLKFRLGLFDGRNPTSVPGAADARSTAERLVAESVVLLKNKGGVLPLKSSIRRVAVIGPLADSPTDQMGTWAMDGRPEDSRTPLAALRQILGASHVIYVRGLNSSRSVSLEGLDEATRAAREADVVLLFLGEEAILSGEARSRAFLSLPGAQDALVARVVEAGKPVVAVIMAGRPLTFREVSEQVDAVLYAWHPGTMGGPAIAHLLFGESSPSGKLTITFPRTVGQIPIYYGHLRTGRPPLESELGVPMGNPVNPKGYTSKYIDVDFTPEYPFGYGLSYTDFQYSPTRASATYLRPDGRLTISAEVVNIGGREADEIVQFYTSGPSGGSVARPVRELKGFRRVHLKAGERQTISFAITRNDLAYYNDHLQFLTERGSYQAWVAPDSSRGVATTFTVE